MKKLIFTSLFALSAIVTFSQTIIPKVGATFSKFGGDDVEDAKFNFGFTLGAGVNFPLGSGPISLQPELNFIQKGSKAAEKNSEFELTQKTKLSYLEIPILVKASFGETTKFHINAGPSIGLGLGGKSKGEFKSAFGTESLDSDIKFGDGNDEDYTYIENRTDFGLQFGGGVVIANKVMIDIRYGLGLSSLVDDYKVKNNVLQFALGFPFNLK